MSILGLLSDLNHHGVRLWVEGVDLRFELSKGDIPESLHEQLALRHNDIVMHLRGNDQGRVSEGLQFLDFREGALSNGQFEIWMADQLSEGRANA